MRELAPPSVLSSWTRVIVDALDSLGIDPAPTLLEGGFAPDSFADPNARLNALATARMWRSASARSGKPAFGIYASGFVRPATFHALGYAVFASTSLRDALERLLRYSHLVSDAAELALDSSPSEVRLSFVPRADALHTPGVPSYEAVDAVTSLIVRTCRTLTEPSFALRAIRLRRTEPEDPSAHARFFRCPIQFVGSEDALSFSPQDLDRRLPTANPELARHNDDLVQRYLAGMREGTVVDRLRRILCQHLSGDASPGKLSGLLGMSSRSLQRRLQEHGTSYAQVLRDTRRDLAMSYLVQPDCSVTEIAFLLGFEDASAFARAFRSWTGVTPSAFRSAQSP